MSRSRQTKCAPGKLANDTEQCPWRAIESSIWCVVCLIIVTQLFIVQLYRYDLVWLYRSYAKVNYEHSPDEMGQVCLFYSARHFQMKLINHIRSNDQITDNISSAK